MVARILEPGCKVDNMIVLEGGQGKYKSTTLELIAGGWYTEAREQVTSKDFYLQMHGKLIIEIAELDAFSKAEVNTIKKVITCRVDRYRPPYGRSSQDFPRQCVFVGTTNEENYLRDHTGGRRFWPIKIGTIDLERIKADRDQLYAEAVHFYKEGATWWEMPMDQTMEQQEDRREMDEWETIIGNFLKCKEEISTAQVGMECLKIEAAKLDITAQRRIGKVMRSLGWEKLQSNREGRRERIWRSPGFYGDSPEY